jgi:hypothetical protein
MDFITAIATVVKGNETRKQWLVDQTVGAGCRREGNATDGSRVGASAFRGLDVKCFEIGLGQLSPDVVYVHVQCARCVSFNIDGWMCVDGINVNILPLTRRISRF